MAGNISIFTGNNDPLLGTSANYDAHYKELERAGQIIEQRKQAIQQMIAQMEQPQHPQQSSTPVWDEIDSVTKGLSANEFELISHNDEFVESQNAVMEILQAKYLQMMRPIVEGCPEGRDILERHLTLLKRLRKVAVSENERKMKEYDEYTEKYPDMPYTEYLKMKRDNKSKKK